MREESTINKLAPPSSTEVGLPKVGYSMKEACRITGLGKTTLWEAIASGRLNSFKVGRRTLFSFKHLEDFMAQYETSPAKRANEKSRVRRRRSKLDE